MNVERLKELLKKMKEEARQLRVVAQIGYFSNDAEKRKAEALKEADDYDMLVALIDEKLSEPTDEAVREAIEWLEADKDHHEREWQKQDVEWQMEPGALEQHESFMRSFDLAIQALRQMWTEPCEICANFKRIECKADNLQFIAVRCPNCGRALKDGE